LKVNSSKNVKFEISSSFKSLFLKKKKVQMHVNREKSLADAAFYKAKKELEINKDKFTPEFLEFMRYQAIAQNTKIYFGNKIPDIFMETQSSTNTANNVASTLADKKSNKEKN
jgi:erlin